MRIIIVRHGDPNYELDTLTKTGWREAELAAEYGLQLVCGRKFPKVKANITKTIVTKRKSLSVSVDILRARMLIYYRRDRSAVAAARAASIVVRGYPAK